RRVDGKWIVNEHINADIVVGAGGHFCPGAPMVNAGERSGPVVAAQEAEFPVDAAAASFAVDGETPELYFSADLNGYGWGFFKQNYLNVGVGLPLGHARFGGHG